MDAESGGLERRGRGIPVSVEARLRELSDAQGLGPARAGKGMPVVDEARLAGLLEPVVDEGAVMICFGPDSPLLSLVDQSRAGDPDSTGTMAGARAAVIVLGDAARLTGTDDAGTGGLGSADRLATGVVGGAGIADACAWEGT